MRVKGAVVYLLGFALAVVPVAVSAGDLEITVSGVDGREVASGTLIVNDKEIPLRVGGPYLVKGLPDRRIAVTAEGPAERQAGKPATRYLGVADIKTLPGKKVSVKVTLQPVTDMNAYCSGCHPARGEPAKPDTIFRDLHVSGKELTARFLPQVKVHNERVAEQRRNKDPKARHPIPLEDRLVVVNGKEVLRPFYTCESCHTLHLRTPWEKAMRAPYIEANDLCVGCHY
jgi:predicted CXXCH cytochrome family protein